jgi:hypothetical protein
MSWFATWIIGIFAFIWIAASYGWYLKWWQMFIFGGIWTVVSLFLSQGIAFLRIWLYVKNKEK